MLLSVMLNACTYNPPLAIETMESLEVGCTNQMLSALLQNIAELARVHDKKVAILGLSSLIGVAHMPGLPPMLGEVMKPILEAVLLLLQQCQAQKEQLAAAAAEAEENEDEEESEDDETEEEEESDATKMRVRMTTTKKTLRMLRMLATWPC